MVTIVAGHATVYSRPYHVLLSSPTQKVLNYACHSSSLMCRNKWQFLLNIKIPLLVRSTLQFTTKHIGEYVSM